MIATLQRFVDQSEATQLPCYALLHKRRHKVNPDNTLSYTFQSNHNDTLSPIVLAGDHPLQIG